MEKHAIKERKTFFAYGAIL